MFIAVAGRAAVVLMHVRVHVRLQRGEFAARTNHQPAGRLPRAASTVRHEARRNSAAQQHARKGEQQGKGLESARADHDGILAAAAVNGEPCD